MQLHDFNPGIRPSGLFWIAQIPDSAVEIEDDAVELNVDNLSVVDDFVFLGGGANPSKVSLHLRWKADGQTRHVREGSEDPTSPFNWAGELRLAAATGSLSGSNSLGFSFHGRVSSFFGETGTERNGFFVH